MIRGSITDINNSDEFYTPDAVVEQHLDIVERHFKISPQTHKMATCFGADNPYTRILKQHGYDVNDYDTFESYLASGDYDRVLLDNPPFSKQKEIYPELDKRNITYALLCSGTNFPEYIKHGAMIFKQPRIKYHNGIYVSTGIFQSFDDLIHNEYHRKSTPNYGQYFWITNNVPGIYTKGEFLKDWDIHRAATNQARKKQASKKEHRKGEPAPEGYSTWKYYYFEKEYLNKYGTLPPKA
jgi:hypothetical protein